MEISFHPNATAVVRTAPARPVVHEEHGATPPAGAEADTAVAFASANALDHALRERPLSRSEFVKRGAELIGDVNYPPHETITKISHLLAMRLYAADGTDAGQAD